MMSAAALVLTGCGLGTTMSVGGGATGAKTGISGKVHGGPNPVTNASVILWQTSTGVGSSYGSSATQIVSTTSDSNGLWNFNNWNCTNGQFVYVTVTGGKTASNSANPNEVLVAPIGDCATLPNSMQVDVSELSTLAVAYALGPFIGESSSQLGTGSQLVWINAPAANNAASGGCTGVGATLACTATGLSQAFATAISLAGSISYSGNPSGLANTVPTDAAGNVANTSASIPQALLNTLGNVLESCVNTSGGIAGSNTACGKLFFDTKNSSVIPSDTLQAAMSIARYPTNNVGPIYQLASTISSFEPALTAQPNDFSLAITYTGSSSASAFDPPVYVVLQPDETVTLLTQNASTTPETLANLSPSGAMNSSVAQTSGLGQATLAVDLTGRLFAASPSSNLVNEYDANSLARTQQYSATLASGLAVDKNSYVYWSQNASSVATIYDLPPSSTTPAQTTVFNYPAPPVGSSTSTPGFLAFDASQNLWLSMTGASNSQINYVFEQTVSPLPACTPPNFCGFGGYQSSGTTGSSYGTLFTSAGRAIEAFNGSVYVLNNDPGNNETLIGSYVLNAGDAIGPGAMDGSGIAFLPDTTSASLYTFNSGNNAIAQLQPCSLRIANSAVQTTACANTLKLPRNAQVDSSGAVWIADQGAGTVIKLIGVASPAWPALALGKPGVEPQ